MLILLLLFSVLITSTARIIFRVRYSIGFITNNGFAHGFFLLADKRFFCLAKEFFSQNEEGFGMKKKTSSTSWWMESKLLPTEFFCIKCTFVLWLEADFSHILLYICRLLTFHPHWSTALLLKLIFFFCGSPFSWPLIYSTLKLFR